MSSRKWDREKPAEGRNVRCIPSSSTGSELGVAELCRSLGIGPAIYRLLGLPVSSRSMPSGWRQKSRDPFPCRTDFFFLLIINTSMNEGRLANLTGVGIVLNG